MLVEWAAVGQKGAWHTETLMGENFAVTVAEELGQIATGTSYNTFIPSYFICIF